MSLVAFELSWGKERKWVQDSLAFYMLSDVKATVVTGDVPQALGRLHAAR